MHSRRSGSIALSMVNLLVIALLFITTRSAFSDDYENLISVNPKSINTTLNSTVTFTCSATAYILNFIVDGVQADHQSIIDKGFREYIIGHELDLEGHLVGIAYSQNNGTSIICQAFMIHPNLILNASNTAYLFMQGPLASVGDLTAILLNGSSVQLTWTPPYTLDNVPIIGYYIDIINSTVNSTNVIISLNDTDPCLLNNVSVYAINGAGIGQPANTAFYYSSVPEEGDISIFVKITEVQYKDRYTLHIYVQQICPGEYPKWAHITVFNATDNTIYENIWMTLTLVSAYTLEGNTSISLPSDLAVNVSLSNIAGEFPNSFQPDIVFGPPGPVNNISSSINNCTQANISWESPLVLHDSDIFLRYQLQVYTDNTLLLNLSNIQESSYQFEDDNIFHHRYTYVITAVNVKGPGEAINETFTYLRVPESAQNTMFILNSYGAIIEFHYTIPVLFQCPNEAPENVTASISCENILLHIHTYVVEYSKNISSENIPVPRHQHCTLSVTFNNNITNSEPLIRELSTYDVVKVDVTTIGSSICIKCHLSANYSEGCFIDITGITNINYSRSFTLQKAVPLSPPRQRLNRRPVPAMQTEVYLIEYNVEGCGNGFPKDNYTVTVYDIENGHPLLTKPAVTPTTVAITVQESSSTSTHSTSIKSHSSSTQTPTTTPNNNNNNNQHLLTIIGVSGILLLSLLVIVLVVVGCLVACCICVRKRQGSFVISAKETIKEVGELENSSSYRIN